MSTYGYEDCVAGTFYGFTATENNEFHPGDTFNLKWGAIDDGKTPLNISLGRAGGTLIDSIVTHAQFTEGGALYQLVVNKTANCSLEQYSWAIPSDFNTTEPQYQIGLFNGDDKLGTAGVPLFGWINWSPYFYVRPESDSSSTVSTSATSTTTATSSATTSSTSPTSSSTSSSTDSTSSSSSKNIGIGVGVGVGGFLLLLALAFYLLRRRRKANQASPTSIAPVKINTINSHPVELPTMEVLQQRQGMAELPG